MTLQTAAEIESHWKDSPRWKGVTRGYSGADVARLRGTVHVEHSLARLGAEKLWRYMQELPFVNALGALTGNQAMQQVRAGLKAIYLSGWQVAGDANLAGEMYPDQSLYPADSVPAVVRRINNTLLRADQICHAEGNDKVDWLQPIVADAEAGFGGVLNAFELMKAMIDAGAAGVHFEDQLSSAKKCGHMGGKVLVPTQEAINKLVAARLAADVCGVPTVLVARTDAESATLLTSDVDERDHAFIASKERTAEGFFPVKAGIPQAIARGLAYAPYADLIWCETGTPDLHEAKEFAEGIHRKFPGKLLAYNCSPSFNWRKKLDDATIAKFQRELGAMGYKFQFITLAGFHALNFSMFELARGYKDAQMSAYVALQQAEFAAEAVGLHRDQAPARGRGRLLRRRHADGQRREFLDHRDARLDRRGAVQGALRCARRWQSPSRHSRCQSLRHAPRPSSRGSNRRSRRSPAELDPRAASALASIDGTGRRLLAARAYLRGSRSWPNAGAGRRRRPPHSRARRRSAHSMRQLRACAAASRRPIPASRSGSTRSSAASTCSSSAGTGTRLSVAPGRTCSPSARRLLSTPDRGDVVTAADVAALRSLLLDHQPAPVPTLAAPGLSPHGRMRAIDFQVESSGPHRGRHGQRVDRIGVDRCRLEGAVAGGDRCGRCRIPRAARDARRALALRVPPGSRAG